MRTLISNLNVIRATRVSGFLSNGISEISAVIAGLTARFAWSAMPVDHREHRDWFWKPLYASVGRTTVDLGGEKRTCFSPQMDQTCPSQSRLWGIPQMTPFAVVPVTRSSRRANRMSQDHAVNG
ncbi:hypothetical protein [Allorhodopirellula solitaria]|uniref:Uncharacterized protein n=1 Tax=Allorhodopirellula solitaria TaxID=2527987 RepID=A0A5C5XUA1_9BACT|nr:hypothetical protein [Allorhodopirellula solitaria]TWT66464.1 hypothetical protein CA85_25590 [Allorhodopirellula solitaria]